MTISVWRYSHLALAVSSCLLLTLASLTGMILAFKPVTEKIQPYSVTDVRRITLAEALPALRAKYPGISELTVDANGFVKIAGTRADGGRLLAYVDPRTCKILGVPAPENAFFQWITALHRSLFLHETGRFFIALTAFLLILTTISGAVLVVKRQRGVRRFFTRISRDTFAQYYHVVLGRVALVPIFLIAISGAYLSLERFHLVGPRQQAVMKIDFDSVRARPVRKAAEFAAFRSTTLAQVRSVEFPFSEDVEDYYTLKLNDRELAVNQVTGDILGEVRYPFAAVLTELSLDLHTGRGTIIWALVLAAASANILFFIYSGFAITLKRRSGRTRNRFKAEDARFVILVGSENGGTFRFAGALHRQLLKQGERSFVGELNDYRHFPAAEYLIVLTATYGLGEAPSNARRFADLLRDIPQQQRVRYSVVGFGSHAYADFCRYAFDVERLLAQQRWAEALVDVHTVNDKSTADFGLWAEAWSQQTGVRLAIAPELANDRPRLTAFTVARRTALPGPSGTFLVSLTPKRGTRVRSGDLLAIYPANDQRERLYSIGVVDEEIRLSVRLHAGGLGSRFLYGLQAGDTLQARIVQNAHFHFPHKAPRVVMIANGTGIAPFIGMLSENKDKARCHVYCGFRERASYAPYETIMQENTVDGQLHVAFSREGASEYVSHIVSRDADLVAALLNGGGVVMICGSLAMQKDVLALLDGICRAKLGERLSTFQSHGRILTDCY